MTAANSRRSQRRPSMDRTEGAAFLRNSELVRPANGIGTGNRAAMGNQLPSKKRRTRPRRVAPRSEENPAPAGGFEFRRNQERPAAAARANAARRDGGRSL